jgi:hypothetical protein
VYAFFKAVPDVDYVEGRRSHNFICLAKHCKGKSRIVKRYLDKGDCKSTSNLRKHAKKCWGSDMVAEADEAKNADEVRKTTVKGTLLPGLITAAFERTGKGTVTYSHRQHTRSESRAEIVRWVSESLRPFSTVSDRGFQSLMKTGRPGYYIPSPTTVSRDVKLVFCNTRKRVAKLLHDIDGSMSFGTDAWTSPNHKAYIAITVHFERNGAPVSMILDLVEVATSHSGVNLAIAFADVLAEFGITNKVS